MKTTATLAALVGYAVAQQAPAYGYGSGSSSSSSSASTTTYACNPAHQYPEGQVCTEIGGSLTLVTKTATAPVGYGTPTSSAATTTTYACNPAHQYPEGQICTTISGSLTLVTVTGTATAPAGYGTTSAATATTSAYVDECQAAYKKCIASGQPEVKCSCDLTTCSGEDAARIREWCASATANLTSTASATNPATYPTSTTSCAAPGSYDSQGQYSCNPAHQYPSGQECKYISGCPVLVTVTSATTSTGSATKPASYPTSSSACPAPGSTDSKGRYSCNPAHQYPEGQTCQLVEGCYFLVGSDVYTTEVQTAYTTICPSPTTFTHEQKTYTVLSSTTITLPCKGGCTKPVTSAPPKYTTPIVIQPYKNTTVTVSKPVYTTEIVTSLTTECPQPTTFTHQQSTYTVTESTVLTLPCKGGCTVTKTQPPVYTTTALTTVCSSTTITHEQSTWTVTTPTTLTLPCQSGCVVTSTVPVQPSATPSCPAPGSTDKNGRYSCNPAHAYPAGQTCEMVDGCYYLVSPPPSSVPVQPTTAPVVPPTYPTASSSFVSQPSATMPGSSTTSLTPYTGAAAPLKTGAPLMAAVAMGALFL